MTQILVNFTPWAQLEASEAYTWYGQEHIRMGDAFIDELVRTSNFLVRNPYGHRQHRDPRTLQDLMGL